MRSATNMAWTNVSVGSGVRVDEEQVENLKTLYKDLATYLREVDWWFGLRFARELVERLLHR
jgi:hypothetical protein